MAKWFSHQMSKTCHVCKWMYFAGLRKWSYSKEGVQEFREFFKYSYDCQAKRREWASWPTSTPNPRTNKLKDIFCYFDFCLWKNVFWSYISKQPAETNIWMSGDLSLHIFDNKQLHVLHLLAGLNNFDLLL